MRRNYERKPNRDTLPAYRPIRKVDYVITDRRAGMLVMLRMAKEYGLNILNPKNMRRFWEIADLCKQGKRDEASECALEAGWVLAIDEPRSETIIMGKGGPEIPVAAIG